MKTLNNRAIKNKQQGAALIVSLIMLLIMTLLGISSMNSTTMEEKMSGNTRDRMLAFQAAEAALKDAEDYVLNSVVATSAFNASGTGGLYSAGVKPDVRADATWSNASKYRTYSGTITGVTTQPHYIIELISTIGATGDTVNIGNYGDSSGAGIVTTFKVTARGTGGTDNAVSMIQAYYGKRL